VIGGLGEMLGAVQFATLAHHLTLIGGVVPGLLLPTLDPGKEPHILEDQFRDLDSAGARAYARFMTRPGDDLDLLARQATGAIREFRRFVR